MRVIRVCVGCRNSRFPPVEVLEKYRGIWVLIKRVESNTHTDSALKGARYLLQSFHASAAAFAVKEHVSTASRPVCGGVGVRNER